MLRYGSLIYIGGIDRDWIRCMAHVFVMGCCAYDELGVCALWLSDVGHDHTGIEHYGIVDLQACNGREFELQLVFFRSILVLALLR